MNQLLNATGWGELPEKELEIPYFMEADYVRIERKLRDAEEMNIYRKIAKKNKKIRRAIRHKRMQKNGVVVMMITVIAFMVIGTLIQ